MNKEEVYEFLNTNGIKYEVTEHKAIFTMQELIEADLPYPDYKAKNLFIRDDKKHNYYLITVKGDKRVNLKALRKQLGTRPLVFAKADELMDIMGLTAGSVTPLGVLSDEERKVVVCLDKEFMIADGMVGCHPNDNTATIWIKSVDLIKIIEEHGNTVQVVELL